LPLGECAEWVEAVEKVGYPAGFAKGACRLLQVSRFSLGCRIDRPLRTIARVEGPAERKHDGTRRRQVSCCKRGSKGLALFDPTENVQTIIDPKYAAESAGLRYVSDNRAGIRRKKSGKGFTHMRPDGTKLSDSHVVRRIRSVAIPPAWTDVWICPSADGHFQATGRCGGFVAVAHGRLWPIHDIRE
jgi:hypothetical protein